MQRLNIAIAGCGPAGLASALLLHRDGHHVTLFERFDAPRPVGSGLMIQPTGFAVLRELGLDGALLDHGARVDRLHGEAGSSGRVVLDVRYAALGKRAAFGVGVHRAALFTLLHQAVAAEGIAIETGCAVAGSEAGAGDRRALVQEGGRQIGPFDLIVDALGTRTPLAPPCGRTLAYGALWGTLDWPENAGFDPAALEQRYRRANVMVGVLPVGRFPEEARRQAALFWSLRADRLEAWRAAGLDAWKAEVAALWPATRALLDQIHSADQLTFARYAHRTLRTPAETGMIHIGDAWHSASPQLGQGANMALLDAHALAQALRQAPDVATALSDAIAMRRRHVHLYQALTALFTPVYQSDSHILPFVRDRIVGPLSKLWPATRIQAAMVSGLIGDPMRPLFG
ncbi:MULTISPECIES: FAD-dependent oxidoreductase [unclassified Sphingomonas]|uniref:FAD-dependent oxidoreductase n=1 Tax=unclassified Sphingomonas TaxID=196159 RepID=UPI0006F96182|nr:MULTISPECIES: NAD(P)/FAD-dependent oxidoreductase [unclassified Sphingomonas]KQM59979.1 glutamate synthase [Sphingomonas sp. Leaf16]KQN11377.1 glutamate synthase [Sphingomonas sp. Leaf29]KQN18699.1 glutamate synthase [Sphingomonas sp. Leaf32]